MIFLYLFGRVVVSNPWLGVVTGYSDLGGLKIVETRSERSHFEIW